ncbi:MAG: hypothetical protein PHX69_00310 [Simplicispira sp.]|uniref:hypothetical protein n=1 Tax=Simplicispira sp. TaxID=2015802 RepID=UPI00258D1FD5|nr:hypothetical protein [Simplicispira sp.]MDD2690209.1 hypothetical protein [Simplicispira sp.]
MAHPQSHAARRLMGIQSLHRQYQDGGQVRGPGTGTSDSIPARLSDGEFVLPADTVRKVGVKSLRDLVHATHAPVKAKSGRHNYANGDLVTTDDQKRPNSLDVGSWAQQQEQERNRQTQTALAQGQATMDAAQANADALAAASKPTSAAAQSAGAQMTALPGAEPASLESRVSQIPTGGLNAPAPDGSHGSWSNTEVGRNVTNSLAALPGVAGALPTIAKTGGAVSSGINAASRLLNAGAVVAAAGPAPAQAPAPASTTAPGAQAGAGAGRGLINPSMADPSKPLPQPGPSSALQPDHGPLGDRTTLTNEQTAIMNPAGRITATRGANGTMEFSGGNVSGQVSYNDANGKALPGGGLNGKGFSAFDVAPAGANIATGPNGSYAFATSGSGLQGQGNEGNQGGQGSQRGGYTSDGIDVRGLNGPQADKYAAEVRQAQAINQGQAEQRKSWENRVAQWNDPFSGVGKARRDMEVSLSGMTPYHHRGKGGAGEALTAARLAAYGDLSKQHFGMAAGDRDDATRRHTSDNTLRGTEMQEQGGTARARLMEAGRNDRFGQEQGLARDKFGLEQTAAGYQNRGAQRIEKAQQDLEAAGDDPAKQRSARQRLLGLMGKQDDDAWQGIALQGATDAHGNKTEGVLAALNKRTGDVRRLDQGAQPPSAAPAEGTRVRGKDGKMYVVKDGKPVLVGG